VRSEEASLEQEGPLVVEPTCDEPVLIEGVPSRTSTSSDKQLLLIVDGAVTPEFRDGWVEDLTK
jgi:hypothetical protein